MRSTVFVCLAIGLFATVAAIDMAPLHAMESPSAIHGEYIVVLKEETTAKEMADHLQVVKELMGRYPGKTTNVSGIMSEYNIMRFHGYAARMSDRVRDLVRSMAAVKYVEVNRIITAHQSCDGQSNATWGIVRTTIEEAFDESSERHYIYDSEDLGYGVNVYILDTGIYIEHPDFGGRAIWGANYIDSTNNDENGHGTHVAGTVMSNTYGVVKKATAIAVKVLNKFGGGTIDSSISGINYAASQAQQSSNKSVANLSYGGYLHSQAEDDAIVAAISAGVHITVAAGDYNIDACNFSPASEPLSITVGASDSADQFAWSSNYGTCVDIIAPGVDILSTWKDGGTRIRSGTSMAAPHVAGVIAKYLSGGSYSPAEMKTILKDTANKGAISGLTDYRSTTPNEMVYKHCTHNL